jgi:osmotically-inducible protein OsmY
MMKNALWMPLAVALVAAVLIAGCTSSNRSTESTGQYVDSAAITAKVKAALLNDEGLKSFDISVETFKDVVTLSGMVDSDRRRGYAGEITARVSGVNYVRNNLVVK